MAKKELESASVQSSQKQDKVTELLIGAIVTTIIAVVIILAFFCMRKRIQLVIQLIKEAGKAIAAMPLILFEPILVRLI